MKHSHRLTLPLGNKNPQLTPAAVRNAQGDPRLAASAGPGVAVQTARTRGQGQAEPPTDRPRAGHAHSIMMQIGA